MPTSDINEVRERTAKRRAGQKFVDKFPAAAPEPAPEFEHVKKEMHKRLPEKMPHVSTGAYDPAMQEAPIGKRPAKFQPVNAAPTKEEMTFGEFVEHQESTIAPAPKAKATRGVSTTDFVFSMRIPVKYERAITLEAMDELDAGTFVKKTKRETKLDYLEHIMMQYLEEIYAERPKAKG